LHCDNNKITAAYTRSYGHRLANVHLAALIAIGIAQAFTLSQGDSKRYHKQQNVHSLGHYGQV